MRNALVVQALEQHQQQSGLCLQLHIGLSLRIAGAGQ